MKQMELLREVGDDFERALFAAAEREPIPLSSKADVARRLGLALPEANGFASAPPATGVAVTPRIGRSIWSKLTFLAAIGALGFVGGGSLLGAGHTADETTATPGAFIAAPSRPTPEVSEPATATKRDPAERPSHPPRDARTASVPAARHTTLPHRVTPTSATLAAASETNDGGLLREVRSLDAVRAALRARDGTRALERLDGYTSEFPHGELALESQVLRVSALVQTEQPAAARALALRTLAVPGSARYRTELQRSLQALERPTAAE